MPTDTNTTYTLKSTANDDNTTTVTLTNNDDDEDVTTFTVATKDTDTYTTGGRYDAATKKLTFTQNDTGKNYEVDLSGLAVGDTAAEGTIGGGTDGKAVSGDTVKKYVDANRVTVAAKENSDIVVKSEPLENKGTKYIIDVNKNGTIGGDKDANLVTGDTVKAELNKLASGDAQYLTPANVTSWQGKLGTGKIADNDKGLVTGDTVKQYVDANKTTVSGDEAKGITVTTDGNDYKVSLGDKLQAGAVTVGGAKGSEAVTGLSNTTWNADEITSGRAATEDQLKAVDTKADKATAAAKAADTKADKATEAAKAADTKADKVAEAAKAADTKAGQAAADAKAADAKAGQATEAAKAADTKAQNALAEAAKHTTVVAGEHISVTEKTGANGGKEYTVAVKAGTIDGNADTAFVTGDTVKQYVDANKTTVSGDEAKGITVTKDGNDYKVSLGDTLHAGAVTVGGAKGSEAVTGLSNTTWNADEITSGRAATEDQLKAVDTQAKDVAAAAKAADTKADKATEAAKVADAKSDKAIEAAKAADTKADKAAETAKVADAKSDKAIEAAKVADTKADKAAEAAKAADTKADKATEAAKVADAKADKATEAAKIADTKADKAAEAAKAADTKADKATEAAKVADTKADKATEAAKVADTKADKAAAAAKAADTKADKATEAAKAADAKADKVTEAAKAADTKADKAAEAAKVADTKADKAAEAAKAADVKADKAVEAAKAADTKADKAAEAAKAADAKAQNALAEAAKHTTVVAGSQITVTESTGANGGKAYTVAAKAGTIGGDKDANLVTGATVKAELDKLANGDARYLTAANVNAWQGKLGTGEVITDDKGLVTGDTVKKALDTVAQADAANLTPANVTSWQAKLGTGKIADDDKGLVTGDTVKQYVDANKTTVSGDEAKGITVIKDGNDYKVSLGDTLQAGAVTVGGAKGSETVTGLANTTWDAANITSGRAATEDQLKAVDTQAKIAQQGVAANRDAISLLGHRLGNMDGQLNRVGAGAAALAALQPQDFDLDHKWDLSMAYGNYRNAHAMALGLYYRPNEHTLFSLGTALGGGENMINAGISLKIGRGEYTTTSKAAMAEEIQELKRQNAQTAQENESIKRELELLKAQVAALAAKK